MNESTICEHEQTKDETNYKYLLEQVGGSKKAEIVRTYREKEDENLEKCIIMGVLERTCERGRPLRAGSDDFSEWTNLSTE